MLKIGEIWKFDVHYCQIVDIKNDIVYYFNLDIMASQGHKAVPFEKNIQYLLEVFTTSYEKQLSPSCHIFAMIICEDCGKFCNQTCRY